MDKYDELIESARDYEAEDYFYEQMRRAGLETREKQEAFSWKEHRKFKRKKR